MCFALVTDYLLNTDSVICKTYSLPKRDQREHNLFRLFPEIFSRHGPVPADDDGECVITTFMDIGRVLLSDHRYGFNLAHKKKTSFIAKYGRFNATLKTNAIKRLMFLRAHRIRVPSAIHFRIDDDELYDSDDEFMKGHSFVPTEKLFKPSHMEHITSSSRRFFHDIICGNEEKAEATDQKIREGFIMRRAISCRAMSNRNSDELIKSMLRSCTHMFLTIHLTGMCE